MENSDAPLSGVDSLQIIRQMIDTAKQEQIDDGKGWILWGWMLFLSSVFTVLNLQFHWGPIWLFWNVFGGITLIFCFINILKNFFIKKSYAVKTYTKDLSNKLNTGFFICLMFIIVAMNTGHHKGAGLNPMIGFPMLMNLYGFKILIYAALLNFKPSIVGAIITWVLAFVCLFVPTFQWVMALHGAAVLFGYIIPGHIAYMNFKKVNKSKIINQQAGV